MRVKIQNSVVMSEDRKCAVITKDKGTVCLLRTDKLIFMINPYLNVNDSVFILYVRKYNSCKECHNKFLHILGKLLCKESDSKYFSKPSLSDHCSDMDIIPKDRDVTVSYINHIWSKYSYILND